eukprot:1374365-Rhodomonas_salina.2
MARSVNATTPAALMSCEAPLSAACAELTASCASTRVPSALRSESLGCTHSGCPCARASCDTCIRSVAFTTSGARSAPHPQMLTLSLSATSTLSGGPSEL